MFSCLFADEDTASVDQFDSSLVRTQSLLSTIVDSVSVISGEWVQTETDFVVIGPEPLILSRGYSPDKLPDKKLGSNWDFHDPHRFVLFEELTNLGQNGFIKALLVHGPGITTHYHTRISQRENLNGHRLHLVAPKGTTNCLSGEISARTNPHNTILEPRNFREFCFVTTGSGQETCYKRYDIKHSEIKSGAPNEYGVMDETPVIVREYCFYKPLYDKKPNGNRFLFKGQRIEAVNPSQTLCYGWIQYNSMNPKRVKVEASDGKMGEYSFSRIHLSPQEPIKQKKDKHKKTASAYCLTKTSFNHKPTEIYEYKANFTTPLLSAKRYPDERFQEIEYYQMGSNPLQGMDSIEVKEKSDFQYKRVKTIQRPVGFDKTPIVTHQFVYEKYDPKKTGSERKTIVYDAYQRKKVYKYNAHHRPISIERHQGDKVYSTEEFVWDDDYTYHTHLAKSETDPLLGDVLVSFPFDCDPLPLRSKKTHSHHKTKKAQTPKEKKRFNFPKQKQGKGNLIGKYLRDKNRSIFHARYFDYDLRGNIQIERIYGNLTGTNTTPIVLDKHHQPKENGFNAPKKSTHTRRIASTFSSQNKMTMARGSSTATIPTQTSSQLNTSQNRGRSASENSILTIKIPT